MYDDDENGLDLLWGCAAIAKAINRTERQTFHLLSCGRVPARKIGGAWVSSRSELARAFRAPHSTVRKAAEARP